MDTTHARVIEFGCIIKVDGSPNCIAKRTKGNKIFKIKLNGLMLAEAFN